VHTVVLLLPNFPRQLACVGLAISATDRHSHRLWRVFRKSEPFDVEPCDEVKGRCVMTNVIGRLKFTCGQTRSFLPFLEAGSCAYVISIVKMTPTPSQLPLSIHHSHPRHSEI
jgi:hypothetical protein